MKTRNLMLLIPAVAGVLLSACKGKTGDYELDRKSTADSVSKITDTTVTPHDSTKLVKTADIRFKVKNVQQTSENVEVLTTKFNGLVIHHNMIADAQQTSDITLSDDSILHVSAFNTSAEMTIKIPSEKIEDFLTIVSHMGLYVNAQRMDVEDKSLDYLATKLKLNNRRELIAQEKNNKVTIKDPNAVLNLKDDLVDEQISNKMIDEQVKYSVINLSFYQSNTISKEIIANDDPTSYHLPFFTQLGVALNNGWYLFSELILGLLNLWVFILCGLGVWLVSRKYYKRKGNLAR